MEPWYSAGEKDKTGMQDYARHHSLRLTEIQKSLIDETNNLDDGTAVYRCTSETMQLLANLCRSINAKRTIDIGMHTGYSALVIAETLPHDGKLITCDISDAHADMARRHWRQAGVEGRIEIRIAPAADTLRSLLPQQAGQFDFAFIDADKTGYLEYYELCLKLVRSGGIIAIDNVMWSCYVIDESVNDEDTVPLRKLNEFVAKDERVHVSMIYIGDGLTLAFVK